MINTSSAYKVQIESDNREYTFRVECFFRDGTRLTLRDKKRLMGSGIRFDGASSSDSSFDLGSAIISEVIISLNNSDGSFDLYDWEGACVILYVGLVLSTGKTEELEIGTYYVDKANKGGVVKTIACLGTLALADKIYRPTIAYPAKLVAVYVDACTQAGIMPADSSIDLGNEVVVSPPDQEITCREILGLAAGLSGGFVTEYPNGSVGIKHYLETPVKTIYRLLSRDIADSDTNVTGFCVATENQAYLAGSEGYVISIADNPLVDTSWAATAAGKAFQNMPGPFRSLKISTTLDPSLQIGDCVEVYDTDGSRYVTYVTALKWSLNGSMVISCGAKTESDQSADRSNKISKTIIKKVSEISEKVSSDAINAYDNQMTQLNAILINGMGYHEVVEVQADGSRILYMCDKPTVEESTIIYKRTVDGFGFSQDGGETWSSGWDASGNAVMNILSAIGINADWINAGAIVIKDVNGNVTFKADTSTGEIILNASSISMGTSNVQKEISDLKNEKRVEQVSTEYYLSSSSVRLQDGSWSRDAPDWIDGKYMWSRTRTIYTDGSEEFLPGENGTCIAGAKGSAGEDAVLLRIESSRGTVFKNNSMSTVLSVVIYKGSTRITNITDLRREIGIGAYLEWSWLRLDDDEYGVIASGDKMLSNNGFNLTVSADEVDTKVTFMCELKY